jgi:hypothetical protein
MDIETRKTAFCRLGEILRGYIAEEEGSDKTDQDKHYREIIREAATKSEESNPWFTSHFIRESINSMASTLQKDHLEAWTGQYPDLNKDIKSQTIGVVNAGNIPFVGFNDFLSVLMSGHIYYGKLSSKDEHLPQAIGKVLSGIEPKFKSRIFFEKKQLKHFDAIIATGSDNTARYFHYYFGKYPHIIRNNRNGVAVLTGNETTNELSRLADDIFLYFGLGCRNVSKVYLPEHFNTDRLLDNFERYRTLMDHYKYANNYDYNKAAFIMNKTPHLDNGFVLLREDKPFASPISILHYERYKDLNKVKKELNENQEQIQCIVTHSKAFKNRVDFGKAQYPSLWDYADNIDTLQFLLSLNNNIHRT